MSDIAHFLAIMVEFKTKTKQTEGRERMGEESTNMVLL